MQAGHRWSLAAVLVAALGLTALAAGATGSGGRSSSATDWYWSEYGAAHALYVNGISWRSGVDQMHQTYCNGLGHWLVKGDGTRLFSHFYCTATPTHGSPYDVIVNVAGPTSYAVSFVDYVRPSTWYWSAQYTANALYRNGIRWVGTTDQVTSDACSPFGGHMPSDSSYYQHFYCSVHTNVRYPYTVVVNVTDKLAYTVKWVDFDNQLPATTFQPRPSFAQTSSSSSSASTATPDCDYWCNALGYVASKTTTSSSHTWVDDALAESNLNSSTAALLKTMYGQAYLPDPAASYTDGISCRNYAYVATTTFTSVNAC